MKPMLAKDCDPAKLTFPLIVQPKLDGVRCVVVSGKARSRSLKPIPNGEIAAALGRPEFEGLDGEIIVGDVRAADAYRRTVSFVMAPDKTGEPWAFHVFDKWNAAGGYADRFEDARAVTALVAASVREHSGVERLRFVQWSTCQSAAELEAIETEYVEAGGEGVILRTIDGPYKFGRSGKAGPLLKLKRFVDFEAFIFGCYEKMHNANEATTNELGRTSRSTAQAGLVGTGTLGGFELRAINGPWAGVTFRCGTGFSAEDRVELWKDYDVDVVSRQLKVRPPHPLVLGRTVKVKAFVVGAKDKPRFPVFLGFRDLEIDG